MRRMLVSSRCAIVDPGSVDKKICTFSDFMFDVREAAETAGRCYGKIHIRTAALASPLLTYGV